MKKKTTFLKRLLFSMVAVMSVTGAWPTEDLANRTTPNNELFYYSYLTGLTCGGSVDVSLSEGTHGGKWNYAFPTRYAGGTTSKALAAGDVITVELFSASEMEAGAVAFKLYSAKNTDNYIGDVTTTAAISAYGTGTATYTIPAEGSLINSNSFYIGTSQNAGQYLVTLTIKRTGADDSRPNAISSNKTWTFDGFNATTTDKNLVNDDLFYYSGSTIGEYTEVSSHTKALQLITSNTAMFVVPAGTGKVEVQFLSSNGYERALKYKIGKADAVSAGSTKSKTGIIMTFGYNVTQETPITLLSDNANRAYTTSISVTLNQETVTLDNTYGYASYSCVNDIDVDNISVSSSGSVTVYKATNADASTVTMESVSGKIPAGTGLILKGTPGATVTIPYTTEASALDGTNLLKAVSQSGSLTSSAAPDGTATTGNYVLTVQGSKVVFAPISENAATMKAGQAYLNSPSSSRSLNIVFDNEVTGIHQIDKGQLPIDNSYYNLAGQRVSAPQKGLYIVNGKKVVVK